MKTQALLEPASSGLINLTRILVPVDFSPLSKKALHYATRMACEFGAEVDILHVVEPEVPPAFDGFMIAPPAISSGASSNCTGQLKGLANLVRKAGVEQRERYRSHRSRGLRDRRSGQRSRCRSNRDRHPRIYRLETFYDRQHGRARSPRGALSGARGPRERTRIRLNRKQKETQ